MLFPFLNNSHPQAEGLNIGIFEGRRGKGFVSKILKIREIRKFSSWNNIALGFLVGFPRLHSRENWTAEGQRNYEGCTFISRPVTRPSFAGKGGEWGFYSITG